MAQRRLKRVGSLIRDEISSIIREQPAGSPGTIISITAVEVAADLRTAKVFVSIYGDEAQREKSFKRLAASKDAIKNELFRRIRLRHIPDLTFVKDTSLEEGSKVSSLLAKLEEEREKDERDNKDS